MPPRDWQLRIRDILDSIATIQEYVGDMDEEAFKADRKTVDAVVRHFISIGEASSNIPAAISDLHPEIPWRLMRDMRNVVVHAYFGVRVDVLWGTVRDDLPPLVPGLQKLLST